MKKYEYTEMSFFVEMELRGYYLSIFNRCGKW